MRRPRVHKLWREWGLIPRLMAAIGFAILAGGLVQNYLLALEGAAEHSARHQREVHETLQFLAPLISDQAVLGDYAAIAQLLNQQAKKLEIWELTWTDKSGRTLAGRDAPDRLEAPRWFRRLVPIEHVEATLEVESGGASYGTVHGVMNSIPATNRLWAQFVHQLQIVFVTLLLMLQLIWLIFRGNLGTLRMLALSANRFSKGDHAVRIEANGAPEVRAAAEAFNEMANSIESLIASLGESEAKNRRLAAIVEQSSEAIWTRDLDGRITTWNAGANVLFGYTADEAIGRDIAVEAAASPEEEQARLERLMAGETLSYETRATTKHGRELDVEVAAAPLHDENGCVVGRICVAHDVTQRKRAAEELRAAREAAEAANKAKSAFLAKMSHEIRTPMNGVLGMTELLLETGLTPTQRKFAETVQRSGKSLLGIINDILDFSKIEAGKLDLENIEFDLRQTIEDAVELLAERAQSKGLELNSALPVDLVPRVVGDPLRLGQVLTNLIGNAIKFTETGEVTVSVTCVKRAPDCVTLRFEVTDTGPGIGAEAIERIFDNFSQGDGSTTRKHGGTGLGLPISKQLVEMMGGTIRVDSTPGAGSTFWFALRFPVPELAVPAAPLAANRLEGIRALIVAASLTTRNTLHVQMSNWGMVNRTVESTEQALHALAQAAARGAPYDVAIVDSALAGSGAIGLAKAIRADRAVSDTRLVMLTPVGRHADTRGAREAGADVCLSKPVRQSALYNCLVTVVGDGAEPGPRATEAQPAKTAPPLATQPRLMLAEDNPVNQQVALGILNIEGCHVTVANNGIEAVDAYAQGVFDLILMDCHMPGMDGYEATRRIREMQEAAGGRRVPIIALTANAMQQDREECLNAGMDDHLSKPYSRAQMRAMLERWLPAAGEREAQPQRPPREGLESPVLADAALDRAALDGLYALAALGDAGFVGRVLEMYLTDAPLLARAIASGLEAGDLPAVARAAHTLKSSSANVGALALSALCAAIETAARAGRAGEVRRLAAQVDPAYRRIEGALVAERRASSHLADRRH